MKDARYAHVTNDARLPAHRMRLVENAVDNMRENVRDGERALGRDAYPEHAHICALTA